LLDEIRKDARERMAKSVASLQQELTKIRTGRAHTSLLDHITVEYYGSQVPLNQVSNVGVEDSRTLTVTPWEKEMVAKIEKAIINSDLGLNPATAGTVIRVPLPPLTEERRRSPRSRRRAYRGTKYPPRRNSGSQGIVEGEADRRRRRASR
jgi:ribosome recycling factor